MGTDVMQGEFSTYVLQQDKEKEETVRRSKQVAFSLPATINNYGQGTPVVNIHSTDDDTLVTIREDGFICLWHPELEPKQSKHIFVCSNLLFTYYLFTFYALI